MAEGNTKGEQTMTRLIDADAFKKENERLLHCDFPYLSETTLEELIDEAPTIDAEPHWIPCSEMLPEYLEPVITWDGNCYFVEKRIPYIRDEDGSPIKGEWWVSDDYDEEETDYYPNLRDGAAIAWMPLPKPYEVEE